MGPYFAVFVEMLGLIGPGPPLLYSPNQDVKYSALFFSAEKFHPAKMWNLSQCKGLLV